MCIRIVHIVYSTKVLAPFDPTLVLLPSVSLPRHVACACQATFAPVKATSAAIPLSIPSPIYCTLPATTNNDGNLLINISLAINKQINANLGHKLRLWPETVQRKMQPASQAGRQSGCPDWGATGNLQLATGNRPYKCKCSTRCCLLLCAALGQFFIWFHLHILLCPSRSRRAQSPPAAASSAAATVLSISISIPVDSLWVFPSSTALPSPSPVPSPSPSSLVFVIPILRYDKLCLHFNF